MDIVQKTTSKSENASKFDLFSYNDKIYSTQMSFHCLGKVFRVSKKQRHAPHAVMAIKQSNVPIENFSFNRLEQ